MAHSWLTERFEENRPRLRGVAYRMLGSLSEAEDAVAASRLRGRTSVPLRAVGPPRRRPSRRPRRWKRTCS
jgi:DNA-directed RNA polymerase specialized sigma24 family protein